MERNILISVIVPVYNVAPYLPDCLDSIVGQSYKNLEIILVDDGSTDGSGDICEEYRAKDSRIKVIHQANTGLSAARNAGHRRASGEYLCFVDSDDFLTEGYCEKLLSMCIESGADMAVCGYTEVGPDTKYADISTPRDTYPVEVIDQKNYCMRMYCPAEHVYIFAWNKLYRKELFEGVEYPVGRLNEDLGVLPHLLPRLTKAAVTGTPLYCYRDRPGSISRVRAFNPGKLTTLYFGLELIDFFDRKGWQDVEYLAMRDYLVNSLEFYSLADKNEPEEKRHRATLLRDYRAMLKKAFKNKASSKKFLLKMAKYRVNPDSYVHGQRGRILYGLEVK